MIRVVPVDPTDETIVRGFHEVAVAAIEHDRVDPRIPTLEDARNDFLPNSAHKVLAWLAYHSGRPAGMGAIGLPLLDNRDSAFFRVAVVPDCRRQGIGGALYDHVAGEARTEGRRKLLCGIDAAPGAIESAPGVAFAAARGLTLRNTMVRRRLRLPLPSERLDALAAKAAARAAGYELISWIDSCPEAYAEQYAHLRSLLSVEAPWGDVEHEQEKWDVARLRDQEALWKRAGQTTYTTVAVAPDGTVAGHTQISFGQQHQGRASQGDTLVLRTHRGHRLGLAVKVANLRAVQADHPELDKLDTSNAEQNSAMVKVNVDMGFEAFEISQLWQGNIDEELPA